MSLRDEIDALIEDFDGWQEYNAEKRLKTADAILALVRAHLTSDEAVQRARYAWVNRPKWGDLHNAFRAAITAALGGE